MALAALGQLCAYAYISLSLSLYVRRRVAEWAASTPLVIALLGLLAGTTTTELLYTTMLALITTGGLFAAAISTGYNATWPIYALGEFTRVMFCFRNFIYL